MEPSFENPPEGRAAPLADSTQAELYLSLWQRNLSAWAGDVDAALPWTPHVGAADDGQDRKSPIAPLYIDLPEIPAVDAAMGITTWDGVRLGPRPLPVHLGLMSLATVGGAFALPLMADRSPFWHLSLGADACFPEEEAFAKALGGAALAQLQGALDGLAAYRRHPYRRQMVPAPVVWQDGTTRLFDYGAGNGGLPLLVVPSLINPAYILDLREDASLLRFLAAQGLRPFLVDWGAPGPVERGFDIDCYVVHRLEPVLDVVTRLAGRPAVLGYCMGGDLALALAARRSGDIAGFAALATPWDFSIDCPPPFRMVATAVQGLALAGSGAQSVPLDMLQMLFAALDPAMSLAKFRRFARLDPASAEALAFVALEDWANDGMALSGPAAAQAASDWYGGNRPCLGQWSIAGETVDPRRVLCPSLVVVPAQDRLVPPQSARALADQLPYAAVLRPAAGHVGMIVGRGAKEQLYRPLAAWLNALH